MSCSYRRERERERDNSTDSLLEFGTHALHLIGKINTAIGG